MSGISAYLFFDGDCAAAFDFYRSVFGGDFAARMHFRDGPTGFDFPPDAADRLMHVSLPVGDGVLMGSDVAIGSETQPGPRNSFALSYAAPTKTDADRVFDALQAGGGAVAMPMEETFWGSYFGMCRDRFGVHWMVNHDLGRS